MAYLLTMLMDGRVAWDGAGYGAPDGMGMVLDGAPNC